MSRDVGDNYVTFQPLNARNLLSTNVRYNYPVLPGDTVLLMEMLQALPVTAAQIKAWTAWDPVLAKVPEMILLGWVRTDNTTLRLYQRLNDELSPEDGCVMRGSRVVIPEVGCQLVLDELHVGHPVCPG